MRVLLATAGGLPVAIPLHCVVRIDTAPAGLAVLRHRLGRPDLPGVTTGRAVYIHGATGTGTPVDVDAVGNVVDALVHPLAHDAVLPALAQPLPVAGVAESESGRALLLDPGLFDDAEHAGGRGGARPAASLPKPAAGDTVLACAAGAMNLRRRPLAAGIPLRAVAGVTGAETVILLPRRLGSLVAFAVAMEHAVPVHDLGTLLGLRQQPILDAEAGQAASPPRAKLVVLGVPAAPVAALCVEAALGTARPLHWAPVEVLWPLHLPAAVAAIPTRARWTAVLDAGQLLAAAAAPCAPGDLSSADESTIQPAA